MGFISSWDDFLPLSSHVDWCEQNYSIVPSIAEFWNTISNSIFFVIPPILIYLFKQYQRQVCRGVNVVWILLIVVGVGSVYFHSTLSLVGQLMDEVAILYVCLSALANWVPSSYLPKAFRDDRRKFHALLIACGIVATALAFVKPEVNHLLLFSFGIPGLALLANELRMCDCPRVYHVGVMSAVWFFTAVGCWVSDRFFCNQIHFQYLHCAWHIFICLGAYMACVCYAYFYAQHECPEQGPKLCFWPYDRNEWFGIPYVSLLVTSVKATKNL